MKIEDAKTRETSSALKKPLEFSNRTSAFTDQHRTEITYLSISQLIPYRNQARTIFLQEEIDALANTIKEHGIRQPLTVLRVDADIVQFEVVSGERRLRAAKQLSLLKVPCIIITDEDKAEEIALIENVQRQDLHPIELARTLKKLMDKMGYGAQSELKARVGLSQPQISELVKLVSLPQLVQDEILVSGYRGRDNFRRLFQLKSEEEQINYIRSYVDKKNVTKTVDVHVDDKTSPQSLLRFTLTENGIHVQKNKIFSLSIERREELKYILLELIADIDRQ
jgi:ParB family chromosome partitioning protein